MARKRVSVEEVLSMLRDIPEDTSECGLKSWKLLSALCISVG